MIFADAKASDSQNITSDWTFRCSEVGLSYPHHLGSFTSPILSHPIPSTARVGRVTLTASPQPVALHSGEFRKGQWRVLWTNASYRRGTLPNAITMRQQLKVLHISAVASYQLDVLRHSYQLLGMLNVKPETDGSRNVDS
jgi:hypothetical protein